MLSVKLKGLIFSRFYFKLKFFHKIRQTPRQKGKQTKQNTCLAPVIYNAQYGKNPLNNPLLPQKNLRKHMQAQAGRGGGGNIVYDDALPARKFLQLFNTERF